LPGFLKGLGNLEEVETKIESKLSCEEYLLVWLAEFRLDL
jgi:hypothetical protein